MVRTALGILLLTFAVGCLPKPKQSYTVEQIPQIGSLEELMRVQAATMDPLFGKRDQGRYSPEEFTAFGDAGRRIKASAGTVRERFAKGHKPSFTTYAEQLATQADALVTAAEASDAAKSAQALTAMRDTCRSCHRENR